MKGMARWNKVEQSSIIIGLLLALSFSNLAFAQENTTESNPPPDTDGDGIVDSADQCINEAETMNGYQDEDGCPDTAPVPDADSDGIADVVDQCINQAETMNGFEDTDGCPDTAPVPDADNDGIADVVDECINQAETMNVSIKQKL